MSPAEGTLRVVTWNIHGGVGADRRCDLGRVAAILAHLRPDVAALQEVDGRGWVGREPRAFERLAALLGGHVAEARLTGAGDGAYGHVLWSRWPLSDVAVHRLPGGRFEPRATIEARVATPLGPLRVLASHFGLAPRDRRRQADFLAELCRGRAPDPTIALGDFNEWRGEGPVQQRLETALPTLASLPTWPARRPFVPMDRIYASPAVRIVAAEVAADGRRASDHLPLIAALRFEPRPGG